MGTVWFVLLALVVTAYVVLDGFDLGAGSLHFAIGRNDEERGRLTDAIGPVWSGNEVWVVVTGGVLFMAFPKVYSGAFSGLYFGMILVLWLLIGRGLALELRHHLDHPLWHQACDWVFCLASTGLTFVLGVALGNVVRGVPLGRSGYFQLTLFHILNWYSLLTGVLAVVVLAGQGAGWLAFRAGGELGERARVWARRLVPLELVGLLAMIGPTYAVRHHMLDVFGSHPWTVVLAAAMLGALGFSLYSQRAGRWERAFIGTSLSIAGLIASMSAGIYPYVLPAHQGHQFGLTVTNAVGPHHGLVVALIWFPIGIALALGYSAFSYRLLLRSPPA